MVINELSVSRRHCQLHMDRMKKEFYLINNKAKFGTTVETKKTEIYGSHEFQRGRTKLTIRKRVKLSFFEKLGFCSSNETL